MINKNKLINEAKKATKYAYVPYSHFKVGAALLCKDGTIYRGANIENASYSLTLCAERVTLFKAYSEGVKKNDIAAFMVIADTKEVIKPCGACLQVMNELLNPNVPIYLGNFKGKIVETNIKKLFPNGFSNKDMNR